MKAAQRKTDNSGGSWPALVYLGFLVIGIPWYWPSDNHAIIAGMPAWVIVAIAVSFLASIFTAFLLWRPWPEETAEFDDKRNPAPPEND